MYGMGIVSDLSIIIISALAGSILAVSLGLPPLLGYIAAGVLIGPEIGLINLSAIKDIEVLSELGVALLLFGLSLEFSLSQLHSVRRIAVFGTSIQLVLTIGVGYLIGYFIGLNTLESMAFGCLISVSSTVVVLKNLLNMGLLSTLSAKIMIGILLVQDLAVIPLMLILPQLANEHIDFNALFMALGKALIIVFVALSLGKKILPWFIGKIAHRNSRELFIISITTVALGVSYLGSLFGFSYAFGAFIAGIALSESDHQHRALADIIPLRDLFVLIFFVSVGMMMDPHFLLANFKLVLSVVMAIMISKALIFYVLARSFNYSNVVPIAVAFGLCQVGEFSFALAQLSINSGAISKHLYNLTVSATVISILFAPFLARMVSPLYRYLRNRKGADSNRAVSVDFPDSAINNHVVVVGGGRVGSFVAKTLTAEGVKSIIIEDNYQTAIKLKADGYHVLFGDASNPTVLEAAKCEKAVLIVIALADKRAVQMIIEFLKIHSLAVPLVARAHSREEMIWLRRLGVDRVVEPFFEAGLEMSMQSLSLLKVDNDRINELTHSMREEVYLLE